MSDRDLRSAVLSCVANADYRPVKPKVIASQLGLVDERANDVRRVIKKLVREGLLAFGPEHLVLPVDADHPATKRGPKKGAPAQSSAQDRHFTGTFRRAAGGFGFVRPQLAGKQGGRDDDVFVSANAAGDAASGDIVRVRLTGKRGRMGKPEGRIIDVVQRATNRFVGTYFEKADMGLVQIDGKVFTSPIYVGDPGAKGAQTDDKVVLDMVRFPSHVRDGEGVIVQVLGARGKPGVDTLSVIHEFALPGDFAEDTLKNARQQADDFDESIGRNRRDLTATTIITIDPVDARDFDDAISLQQQDNGHWLLGVHIADVSHFVRPKSALDREAHDRATSVYLPDRVIPMLPELISNNLASLQPDKVRYAMTAMLEMTDEGVPVATDVFKSAIKSRRRFTYEEVDEYLANPRRWQSKLEPEVHTLVGQMHTLAMRLRKRRFERGALELSMSEVKLDFDKQGDVVGAHAEENTESHQIIEEFMLAANEAVARQLADASLLFLRRLHGDPDPRKSKALTEFVKDLGFPANNLQDRFELQQLLGEVEGDPRAHAVNFAVLRSMQRAVYGPEEEGHYALASDCYCHFTSPIRRYPDLTVHRLLDAVNRGRPPEQKIDALLALGDHCSDREQRATQAERELTKVKLLNHLADKIGMELDGVITGVESFGLFITGVQLPAEGFVHISALADDYYRYDRGGHVISGFRSGNEYRLGDSVQVSVASVNVDARELDFRLLGRSRKASRAGKPAKKSGPAARPKTKRRRGKGKR